MQVKKYFTDKLYLELRSVLMKCSFSWELVDCICGRNYSFNDLGLADSICGRNRVFSDGSDIELSLPDTFFF